MTTSRRFKDCIKMKKLRKSSKKGIQDEEVLLFKPYEELIRSDTKSSFIQDEVKNLKKHMKFVQLLTRTRIFSPLPHYKSVHQAKSEQDSQFW